MISMRFVVMMAGVAVRGNCWQKQDDEVELHLDREDEA